MELRFNIRKLSLIYCALGSLCIILVCITKIYEYFFDSLTVCKIALVKRLKRILEKTCLDNYFTDTVDKSI